MDPSATYCLDVSQNMKDGFALNQWQGTAINDLWPDGLRSGPLTPNIYIGQLDTGHWPAIGQPLGTGPV